MWDNHFLSDHKNDITRITITAREERFWKIDRILFKKNNVKCCTKIIPNFLYDVFFILKKHFVISPKK